MRKGLLLALVGALLVASPLRAEDAAAPPHEESETELAKKTQNPVADLISVPFQNNFNFNTGPENRTVWVLNVQPVIPIKLTEHWNLITRTIMPIINQPSLAPGVDQRLRARRHQPDLLLLAGRVREAHLGRRPDLHASRPRATRELGSGKWSAGPDGRGAHHAGPVGGRRARRTTSGRSPAGATTT